MGTSCARALVKLYLFLYCRPPDCCVSPARCTDSVMRRITRRRRIIPRFHTVKEFLHQVNNSKKEPNWDLNNVLADLLHSKTKGVGGGGEGRTSVFSVDKHAASVFNMQRTRKKEKQNNNVIVASCLCILAFSFFSIFFVFVLGARRFLSVGLSKGVYLNKKEPKFGFCGGYGTLLASSSFQLFSIETRSHSQYAE